MKPLFFLTLFLLAGCSHTANDRWTGQDKAQHFLASAVLTAAGTEVAHRQGHSPVRSANLGFLFSVSLGAGKELWDSRSAGTGWSWKDFAWDIAGAATGYTVWRMAEY